MHDRSCDADYRCIGGNRHRTGASSGDILHRRLVSANSPNSGALGFATTADARSHHKRHHYSSMNSMEPKAGANSSPTQAGTTTPPRPSSKASTSETPKR